MITQASGLTKLRSFTGRGRKQSHLPKGCVLKDNRKQNQLPNFSDSLQNADMESVFKVYEEFQDGGNSFKPCVRLFLAQDWEPTWVPSLWTWPLQVGGTWLHCYLWFFSSSWSISIWGFYSQQQPLWWQLMTRAPFYQQMDSALLSFWLLPSGCICIFISFHSSLSNSLR